MKEPINLELNGWIEIKGQVDNKKNISADLVHELPDSMMEDFGNFILQKNIFNVFFLSWRSQVVWPSKFSPGAAHVLLQKLNHCLLLFIRCNKIFIMLLFLLFINKFFCLLFIHCNNPLIYFVRESRWKALRFYRYRYRYQFLFSLEFFPILERWKDIMIIKLLPFIF